MYDVCEGFKKDMSLVPRPFKRLHSNSFCLSWAGLNWFNRSFMLQNQ